MASTIGKVRAVFTASTSGLTAGVNSAAASMKKMESASSSLGGKLNALVAIQGAQLFGSIVSGVSQAVSSLVSMGQAQAEVIDSTSKMAARLGMTYGEFAGLSLAGNLAGVSMDTIAAAATRADVAFVKAVAGSKTATAAFSALGLSVNDLNGLSAADRFDAIASAIAALPTEAERAAAAVQVFGKAGAQLLPLFAGGAEGIAAARAEAEAFGLTLTNAQGQDVEEMNDSFTRAQSAIQGVIQQIVAYLSPAVTAVTTAFSDFVGSVGGANIGQAIGDGILQGARFFAQVADYFIAQSSVVWAYVSQIGAQWNSVWEFGNRVASFIAGVANVFQVGLGTVILAFGASFQGLATIAQQIGKYLGFDTSTLDAVVAGAAAFNDSVAAGIEQNAADAAKNFQAAFGETSQANQLGEAVAGPIESALGAAVFAAQSAASQQDVAVKQTVEVQTAPIDVSPVTEAVKGIDSRSKDGVAEMFRIMRGAGKSIDEEQLGVLQQIANNTSAEPDDLVEYALP